MGNLIPSLKEEEEMWAQIEKINAARAMAAQSVTQADADRITALHESSPHLPSGAKVSLGRAGVTPDSPLAQRASEVAIKTKLKRGFGLHSIGDGIKAGFSNTLGRAVGGLGQLLGPAAGAIGHVLKPTIRTGLMAIQAPIEEATGLLRNVATGLPGQLGEFAAGAGGGAALGGALGAASGGGIFTPLTAPIGAAIGGVIGGVAGLLGEEAKGTPQWTTQSELGIAVGRLVAGKKVDAGEGFFVGHDTGLFNMQANRAMAAASVEGEKGKAVGWTLGRSVANTVAEPGSLQHRALSGLIDGYAAAKLDPSFIALAKRSKIVAARKTIDSGRLAEFMGGGGGDALKAAVAAERSPMAISQMFSGQLAHDPKTLMALAREGDPIKVGPMLEKVLGVDVKTLPKLAQQRTVIARLAENTGLDAFGQKIGDSRLMADVPKGVRDLNKPAEAIKKMDDFLKISKVPEAERVKLMDDFIGTLAGPTSGNMAVLKQAMKSVETVLVQRGAKVEEAKRMTTMFAGTLQTATEYTGQTIAAGTALNDLPFLLVGGEKQTIQNPHLVAELLNSGIPLPNVREIARNVARTRRIVTHPLTNAGTDAAEWAVTGWKQMAILRAAYIPRVVGEEMVRMATSGYDSLFKHPMSFIAQRIATKGVKVGGRTLVDEAPVLSLHNIPLTMEKDAREALNAGRGSEVLSRSPVRFKGRVRIALREDQNNLSAYKAAWRDHELSLMSGDPIAARVAEIAATGSTDAGRTVGIDGLKRAFADPTGHLGRYRNELKNSLAGSAHAAHFDDVAKAEAYIDSVVERVTHFTQNDPVLREALYKGTENVDKQAMGEAMDRLIAAGHHPPAVVGDAFGGALTTEQRRLYNKVTDAGFEYLATKPTNFMSRSPVLEQAYWQNVERMLPALSPTDQAEALRLARASKLPARRIKELEAQVARSPGHPFVAAPEPLAADLSDIPDAIVHPSAGKGLPTLYHGTPQSIAGELDTSGAFDRQARNLFGSGFYTTSEAEIAGSYVKKGARSAGEGAKPTVYGVRWTGKGTPKVLDLEQSIPQDVADIFRREINSEGRHMDAVALDDIAELNRMLDEGAPVSDVYRKYKAALADSGEVRAGEADEIISDLNQSINDAGYDAMRYQGGKYAAKGQGAKHDAFIWLDQSKIKIEETYTAAQRAADVALRTEEVEQANRAALAAHDAKMAAGVPPLTLDDVHTVAARQATTEVKKLLYDLSARKQWSEASRLVFPFAEAWQEMMVTWGRLLVENPQAIRRGQQVVEGARGAGFFHPDQYGQEVFTYPGSSFASKLITGAPIPVSGSVSGLNLFANSPVLPGFGPVVQIAADMLVPDKPEFDWVQDVISPYGRNETDTGFLESFFPSWVQKVRKVLTSDESDRVFNNTVLDMAAYLQSAGRGDVSTVEGQEQLTKDAISMAKRVYLLRAMGSFALPAAPQPEMIAQDKDGRVMTQFKLLEEYRALQMEPGTRTKVGEKTVEGVGWQDAPQHFIETFGEDALLFMQPKSKGGGPPLEDTFDWVRSNPDLAKRFENTYQFFAPHAGAFSMNAYERQIASGQREALTPGEAYRAANSRVASMQYRQAQDLVGPKPSKEQRAWLTQVKDALVSEYAGYEPEFFDAAKIPRAVRELERAAIEPKFANTEAGKAIASYMEAREKAIAAARAAGLTGSVPFSTAKAALPLRQWLRDISAALIEEHPAFGDVWDQLLSRELASDDTAEIPQ